MRNSSLLLTLILIFSALAACSPGAAQERPPLSAAAVPVLIYHEITDAKPPGETVISPQRFQAQMQFLADNRYHTLSTAELLEFLAGKPVPPRSVVLHFDDGWKSQAYALPILRRHRFKATFWIITGAVEGNFGPDYFSWAQVESLVREPLFEVQSHSVTHPWDPHSNFLTWSVGLPAGKSMADVHAELVESRKALEAHLGKPVRYWAWPCGWTNPGLTRLAKDSGYEAQMTTRDRPNIVGGDPAEIPRYFVNGSWDAETFARFLHRTTQGSPITTGKP